MHGYQFDKAGYIRQVPQAQGTVSGDVPTRPQESHADSRQIAVAYKNPDTGEEIPSFPADLALLERAEVVYHEMDGWNTSTTHATKFDDLPPQARAYVEFIENFVGVKIAWIGTGPKREDMIVRGI